jgi:hypothetical protein
MPAHYLSRLPASATEPIIAAFDPFQTGLPDLQREEQYILNIHHFYNNCQWPANVSRTEANSLTDLVKRIFNDKDNVLWVQLTDYKYPRTALLLLNKYQKEALCEAHNSIFGGHDANLKTYLKISSS